MKKNNKSDLLSCPWGSNKNLSKDYFLSQNILDNYAKNLVDILIIYTEIFQTGIGIF